jgi:hypothetical protein
VDVIRRLLHVRWWLGLAEKGGFIDAFGTSLKALANLPRMLRSFCDNDLQCPAIPDAGDSTVQEARLHHFDWPPADFPSNGTRILPRSWHCSRSGA